MVLPSKFAFSRTQPLFQHNFGSNQFFCTKMDQKMLIDGFLETAWIYLSFETNRLKNIASSRNEISSF